MLGEFRLANLVMRQRVNIWACEPVILLAAIQLDVVGGARAAAENR